MEGAHAWIDPFAACNWAVGTFMLVSLGTWYVLFLCLYLPTSLGLVGGRCFKQAMNAVSYRTICQQNILEERRRVQTIVEQLPKRMLTKSKDSETPS